MKNSFYNPGENRIPALFRIIGFVFLFLFFTGIPTLIPFPLAVYITQSLLALILFYGFFRYVDKRHWQYSGLIINKTWLKECAVGIMIAAATMGLIFLTQWQTGTLEITGYGWERSFEQGWLMAFVFFSVRMISVGFYEELMTRGYLIPNITEGFTLGKITPQKATIIAITVSSALFGIMHAGNPNASVTAVINIFLAGVMLAVPFVLTGRLALSIGIHFSWNFFQAGIFGFRVSGLEVRSSLIQIQQGGSDWWTGGAFGPEAGVIGILGILLILATTLLYLKWSGKKLEFSDQFKSTFQTLNAPHSSE